MRVEPTASGRFMKPENLANLDLKTIRIPSSDGRRVYTVVYSLDPVVIWECSCMSFHYKNRCKHIQEVEDFLKNF